MRRAHLLTCIALAAAALGAGPPVQTLVLDPAAGGPAFEGVGAVSGGGATSVLLKDYPQRQRDQVLDLLFKPNFAASMQALYVEVGGDGNSTQGSEPSHMRTPRDLNFSRGYEWWLMAEAKRRNPALTLDGCAWSCPGWVGDGTYWSQDMADYYVSWIKGLKSTYGLDLDAVGCRNEWGTNTDWVERFRRTLDAAGLGAVRIHAFDNPGNPKSWDWIPQLKADPALAAAVGIVGNHTSTMAPPSPAVRGLIASLGKPTWDTEEHVYDGDNRHYGDDWAAAIGALHLFNDNFISVGATKVVNWYLVGSTYGIEPYADQPPAMIARSPWSGHYALKPIMWAYAHYGQFTRVGWRYLPGACQRLAGGGTVVAMRSDAGDYSLIAETAGAAGPQQVTVRLAPGLSDRPLCLWRTTRASQFARLADVVPADRSFSVTLEPDAMYSLSTTTGQQKGTFDDVPPERPFPFPYFDDFAHYGDARRWGYLPHYTADICGGFELADRPDHAGACLRQVIGRKAQSWAPEWMPYTILGDASWTDYDVAADIGFDDGGWAGVMGRVTRTGDGWNGIPDGYYARLYPDGGCAIYLASHDLRGSHDKQLAVGQVAGWKDEQRWHNLRLRFSGATLTLLVDGHAVLSAHDAQFDHGMAGLVCGGEGSARNTALFGNLLVCPVNGTAPAHGTPTAGVEPMYGR